MAGQKKRYDLQGNLIKQYDVAGNLISDTPVDDPNAFTKSIKPGGFDPRNIDTWDEMEMPKEPPKPRGFWGSAKDVVAGVPGMLANLTDPFSEQNKQQGTETMQSIFGAMKGENTKGEAARKLVEGYGIPAETMYNKWASGDRLGAIGTGAATAALYGVIPGVKRVFKKAPIGEVLPPEVGPVAGYLPRRNTPAPDPYYGNRPSRLLGMGEAPAPFKPAALLPEYTQGTLDLIGQGEHGGRPNPRFTVGRRGIADSTVTNSMDTGSGRIGDITGIQEQPVAPFRFKQDGTPFKPAITFPDTPLRATVNSPGEIISVPPEIAAEYPNNINTMPPNKPHIPVPDIANMGDISGSSILDQADYFAPWRRNVPTTEPISRPGTRLEMRASHKPFQREAVGTGPTQVEMRANPSRIPRPIVEPIPFQKPTLPDIAPFPTGESRNPKSVFGRVRQNLITTSGNRVLKNDSPAGKVIADTLTKTRLISDSQAGQWRQKIKDATKGLTKTEWDTVQQGLDSGTAPIDSRLRDAWTKLTVLLDDEIASRAEKSGMGFKTEEGLKIVPWKRMSGGYWPRIYDEVFLKDSTRIIDKLVSEGIDKGKAEMTVKRAGEYGGRLITEAQRVGAERARKFGERYIDSQHAREANIPGYRKDIAALEHHVTDMAKRIVESEQYGPMDIADKQSPLGKLVAQTNDQNRITDILRDQLGRGEKPRPDVSTAVQGVTKVESAIHLSKFLINNLNQISALTSRNTRDFAIALKDRVVNPTKYKENAMRSGALQTVDTDILNEAGGRSPINTAYGIKYSEGGLRSAAANTGIHAADRYMANIRKNPKDFVSATKLRELIMEDPEMNQAVLTDAQRMRAGGRMSELTQGRAQPMDLPSYWSASPVMNLVFLYKKYGFRQGVIVRDAIKAGFTEGHPVSNVMQATKNVGKLLAMFQLTGEVTGDMKAAFDGFTSGVASGKNPIDEAMKEMARRGEFIGTKSDFMNRVVENYLQAWMLGLPADAFKAMAGNKEDIYRYFTGIVSSDVVDLIYNSVETARGKPEKLAKQVVKSLPYFGSGLNKGLFPKKQPNASSIPNLPPL